MKHTRYKVPNQEEVQQGWVDLLCRYEYDVFATLTFPVPRRNANEVMKAFGAWLFRCQEEQAIGRGLMDKEVEQKNDGYGRPIGVRVRRRGWWWNRWRKGFARPVCVVGVEPHASGDLHVHAMIKYADELPDLDRRRMWQMWKGPKSEGGMGYGMARIEPPKSNEDVTHYCSKYVISGDLFISDSFRALTTSANLGEVKGTV